MPCARVCGGGGEPPPPPPPLSALSLLPGPAWPGPERVWERALLPGRGEEGPGPERPGPSAPVFPTKPAAFPGAHSCDVSPSSRVWPGCGGGGGASQGVAGSNTIYIYLSIYLSIYLYIYIYIYIYIYYPRGRRRRWCGRRPWSAPPNYNNII